VGNFGTRASVASNHDSLPRGNFVPLIAWRATARLRLKAIRAKRN
jgi:hypothetical protein